MRHARDSAPSSLNPIKIQCWMDGRTKTANFKEWNFVMDAPEQVVEAAISGTRVQQHAVAVQIDSNEVWINARAAQVYADREIDDLADRRNVESGDELASTFGDLASEGQFADARDTTPAAPRNESNSVPGLG